MQQQKKDISKIVQRMKDAISVDNNYGLASMLEISSGAISEWKKTGKIPEIHILRISKLSGLSIDFIKYGEVASETRECVDIYYYDEDKSVTISKTFLLNVFDIQYIPSMHLRVMVSKSDAMHPLIPVASKVFFLMSNIAHDGSLCLVMLNHELLIRKLQKLPKLKLIPLNQEYDHIEVAKEDNFEILGTVIGVVKKII